MSGNGNVIATIRICVVNPLTLTVSVTYAAANNRIDDSLLKAVGRAKGVRRCECIYTNSIGISLTGGTPTMLAARNVCRKIQAFFRSRRQFAKVVIA